MQAELEGEYVEFVTARLLALRRFAFLLCGDEHRADDLVQHAITRLYEHWRRARAATSVNQYARTILLRAFLDERRRGWSARVWLTSQPPENPAPAGPDLEQQAVLVLRFRCDRSRRAGRVRAADPAGAGGGLPESGHRCRPDRPVHSREVLHGRGRLGPLADGGYPAPAATAVAWRCD